jgi:predicted aspartyl protease
MTLKRKLKPIPGGEINMGLTRIPVKLARLDSPARIDANNTYNADFLVDTAAMDSMAPASELRKIGITPVGKRVYEFANGEVEEYEHGLAQVSFMNETTWTDIIFGPENSEPILGVITLEIAGVIVDPKNERLRKLRARPLKQAALAK